MNDLKDKAVIFKYHVAPLFTNGVILPIKLKGLDPTKKYKIEEVNLYPGSKSPIDQTKIYSGDFLMRIGFNPEVNDRRTSVVLLVKAV